jgi:hypothetical protein
MAQFSYESYSAQQAAKRANSTSGGQRPEGKTRFVNEWLKNDGDSVVVRFPYKSMNDINFETTHTVTFPGDRFGKRVRCEGDNCPLCKQGVKVDTRFFVKAIVYVTDPVNGTVSLIPAIWDRPAAFADIDLKGKMQEATEDFGTTLDNLLVRIKRNGSGLTTTYDLSLSLNNNKAVYNPSVFKADFSGLEGLDPSKILTKSVEQYMKALNPEAKSESKNLDKVIATPEEERQVEQALNMAPTPAPAPVVTPAPQPETTPAAETTLKPKRYTF